MHPLATFALLRLAGEAGSDNRSVFKFFAPEFETGEEGWVNVQPYSYPWFIENNDIEEMSTRQLKKAIDELNKTKNEKEALEKEINDLKSKSNVEQDKLKENAKKNEKIAKELKEEARNSMESSKAKILEKINESKVEETLP